MPTKVRFAGVNHTQLPQIVSDGIALKGLPQTPGYPAGYGSLVGAINGIYKSTGAIKVGARVQAWPIVNGRTSASTFILQGKPARMRLHLLNVNTAEITGVRVAIAPSANIASPFIPSGTVSALKLITIPSTIPAATISAANASVVPSQSTSDWFNPLSLDRDDGGDGYIFMLRVFNTPAAGNSNLMATGATSPTTDPKYKVRTATSGDGDFVTTTGTFNEGGNGPAFWLDVEYEQPTASLFTVGDSIMAGANSGPSATSSSAYGAAFIAVSQLQAEGKTISFANGGWSGASTHGTTSTQLNDVVAGYLGQFMSYVESGARPTIAALCPWSVNNTNPYTSAQESSVKQSIAVFVALCENNKITPSLVTPAPVNGLSEASEAFRRKYVQIIKDYCLYNNVLLIDRDAVYTNYSTPTGGYKLPEWCLDNVHPTELGHIAESVEWASALSRLL
jgi:hypothetical protein